MEDIRKKVAEYLGISKSKVNVIENVKSLDELFELNHATLLVDTVQHGTVRVEIGKDKDIKGIQSVDKDKKSDLYA